MAEGTFSSESTSIPWTKIILVSLALFALIIVVVFIVRYQRLKAKSEVMLLDPPTLMTVARVKSTPDLSAVGREYTYNFWINVNDWSKGYGNLKHVLTRANKSPTAGNGKLLTNPTIWMYPQDNKLAVRVSTMKTQSDTYDSQLFPNYDVMNAPNTTNQKYTVVNPYFYENRETNMDQFLNTTVVCDIANIPLQRWVMVTVTLWNRTLDVYVNGMLVRSAVLPGVPYFSPSGLSNIYVGNERPSKTFNGYISRLKYYDRSVTAKEVKTLYEKGPLPASYWWSNIRQNIKLTLDVTQD